MTCEALVIGSLAGLALTGAVLFLQVLTDKKTWLYQMGHRLMLQLLLQVLKILG
jgi:hypothetical protein